MQKLTELSSEEMEILRSIERYLTKEEFEVLVQTARMYLDDAARKVPMISLPDESDLSPIEIEPTENYDWSKHPKITVDDFSNSQPERVKKLLRLDFLPRRYQIRMIRPGLKNENSLVCLQTGAGKTFVRSRSFLEFIPSNLFDLDRGYVGQIHVHSISTRSESCAFGNIQEI